MRRLAPSGTPVKMRDIAAWLGGAATPGRTLEDFRAAVCAKFNVRHCFFLSSGRAALCVLLDVFRELASSERDEVVIPSYTCYSVPSTIAKSGLKVLVRDIDPETLDYSLTGLRETDWSRVLCVITANLYGMPNSLPDISRTAKENGAFLIDDASQCMGGMVKGRFSGTFGDAGVFSLDKGKNITSMQGGVIVTDSDEIASRAAMKIAALPSPPVLSAVSHSMKLLAYAAFLNPRMYWLPESLPFLNLGATVYTTEYPVEAYSGLLAGFGAALFRRFDAITEARVRNGTAYAKALSGISGVEKISEVNNASPVYLRYPILVTEKDRRRSMLARLKENGIGATASFPRSVIDLEEIGGILNKAGSFGKNGTDVAERIITLPTHPFVTERDIERAVSVLKSPA